MSSEELYDAVNDGDTEEVQALLHAKANPIGYSDSNGIDSLMRAVMIQNGEILALLLATKKADINTRSKKVCIVSHFPFHNPVWGKFDTTT